MPKREGGTTPLFRCTPAIYVYRTPRVPPTIKFGERLKYFPESYRSPTPFYSCYIVLPHTTQESSIRNAMLDVFDFLVEKGGNPEKIKESQRRRYAPEEAVDEVIALYEDHRRSKSTFSKLYVTPIC